MTMPKYNVLVGEDSFGIFIEVADYNDYDELEDIFIEQYDLDVLAVQHADKSENGKYQIWFGQSLGIEFIKKVIDEINNKRA
jgi:hypothetical protein